MESQAASIEPMKVLVAEDDPDLRRMLAAMIVSHGFQVVEAKDGEEAWALFQEHQFPIVLTDWLMPRMDGMDLIRSIREHSDENYSYIIMLTGLRDANAFKEGMEAGVDDMLAKPYSAEELFARLNVARRIMRLGYELAETNRTLRRSNRELKFFRERVMRELEGAAKVQESLLPTAMTGMPGFKVAWSLIPCEELAGDVLNILPLDDDHVAFYVLDVSGHGVSAALLSAQLSRLLNPDVTQSQLLRRPINGSSGECEILNPRQVMEELNGLFQMDPTEPQFFTLIYGVLDIEEKVFTFSSAGHPGPIRLRADGKLESVSVSGTPIGMLKTGSWSDKVIELEGGDRLVMFSDGLVEATNGAGEMFGDSRLLEILGHDHENPVGTCCGTIMENLEAWCGTRHLQDDCSILMIELD